MSKEIYPLTIVRDRYGGTYSGGEWLAFNKDPYEISDEPFADDVTCMMFWDEKRMIGVGETREFAITDLKRKLQKAEVDYFKV